METQRNPRTKIDLRASTAFGSDDRAVPQPEPRLLQGADIRESQSHTDRKSAHAISSAGSGARLSFTRMDGEPLGSSMNSKITVAKALSMLLAASLSLAPFGFAFPIALVCTLLLLCGSAASASSSAPAAAAARLSARTAFCSVAREAATSDRSRVGVFDRNPFPPPLAAASSGRCVGWVSDVRLAERWAGDAAVVYADGLLRGAGLRPAASWASSSLARVMRWATRWSGMPAAYAASAVCRSLKASSQMPSCHTRRACAHVDNSLSDMRCTHVPHVAMARTRGSTA